MSDGKTVLKLAGWAIVELMGHRRLAGWATDEEVAGVTMLRIDVPEVGGHAACTQYYHPQAIYCLTPTTEDVARVVAERDRPQPVHPWEIRSREGYRPDATPAQVREDDDEDDIPFEEREEASR